jgi:hypothetical protein
VIYGVLFYAAKQMENFAMQGMMVAGAIGTAFEKTAWNKNIYR